MRRLIHPSPERLDEVLHYNPLAGTLVWKQDRLPGARRGTNAGYLNTRAGTITVNLDGHRYQAHHLIWFMAKGEWPLHQIVFRDRDPTNLRLANLRSVEEVYSDNPKARMARDRRRRKQARRAEAYKIPELTNEAFSVTYDKRTGLWSVLDGTRNLRFYQQYATRTDAEAYAAERLADLTWLNTYNQHWRPTPGDDQIHAGTEPGTETYAEIAELIAYNPQTGRFYHRDVTRPVLRADTVTTTGRSVVSVYGRYFPCAMLAWFLTHRQWPKPKQIGWRNGDNKDNRLSNLMNLKAHR